MHKKCTRMWGQLVASSFYYFIPLLKPGSSRFDFLSIWINAYCSCVQHNGICQPGVLQSFLHKTVSPHLACLLPIFILRSVFFWGHFWDVKIRVFILIREHFCSGSKSDAWIMYAQCHTSTCWMKSKGISVLITCTYYTWHVSKKLTFLLWIFYSAFAVGKNWLFLTFTD